MKKFIVIGLVLLLVVAVVGYSLVTKDEKMMNEESSLEHTTMNEEENMNSEMNEEDSMMEEDSMTDEDSMMEEESMMMNDGPEAPDFTLMSIKGEEVSLKELKGGKVYVKFWASWCSICLAGMEELDMLAAEATDFKVYTIVAPGHNGEKDEEEFIEWFNTLEYDNVEVLLDKSGEIMKAYGVRAVPSSAYVGSDGVLVKFTPGHMSNNIIYSFFDEIN